MIKPIGKYCYINIVLVIQFRSVLGEMMKSVGMHWVIVFKRWLHKALRSIVFQIRGIWFRLTFSVISFVLSPSLLMTEPWQDKKDDQFVKIFCQFKLNGDFLQWQSTGPLLPPFLIILNQCNENNHKLRFR